MQRAEFLKIFIQTAFGLDGTRSKGDFERNHYETITQVIDPAIVIDFLKTIYGDEIEIATEKHHYYEKPFEDKICFQFAQIHHYVRSEKEQGK